MNSASAGKPIRDAQAKVNLSASYRKVFMGNGTIGEAEAVLVDLALQSRFFDVMPPTASDAAIRYNEGRRSVFLHIFQNLSMSESELAALQEAVRFEAQQGETE